MGSFWWPRPAILAEIPSDHHAIIEASAGTGKTYTLEHMVIDLLLVAKVRIDEILVVTFTERAASELKVRLRNRLLSISRNPEDPGSEFPPNKAHAWTIGKEEQERLKQALLHFDRAVISTIHAFCQHQLKENAFLHQRLFDQRLADTRLLFGRAFINTLRQNVATDVRLHPYLEAWMTQKSLTSLEELLYACHQQKGQFFDSYRPDALVDALGAFLKLDTTPHRLKPALKRAGISRALSNALLDRVARTKRLATEALEKNALASFLDAWGLQKMNDRPPLETLIEAIQDQTPGGILHSVREALIAIEALYTPLTAALSQLLLPLVRAQLRKEKDTSGQYDFEDMLSLLEDGVSRPDAETFTNTLNQRFRYVLIDEFQDTDKVQWSLFERIYLRPGSKTMLRIISDPKQAIYGFRGADVQTYLAAKAHILEAGGVKTTLTTNYRATPAMIRALNRIFDQNQKHPFFSGEIRYDHPVEAQEKNSISLERRGLPVPPVHVFEIRSATEKLSGPEAHAILGHRIAQEIATLLDENNGFTIKEGTTHRPIGPEDIFVLTRTRHEALDIAKHLVAAQVPFGLYKQEGLFQTPEADEILHLLVAIDDPTHRAHRLRAWRGPFFGLRAEELAHAKAIPSTHPLMVRLLGWHELAKKQSYSQLFRSVGETSGIVERELFLKNSERALTNYLHIFEILLEEALRTQAPFRDIVAALIAFREGRRFLEGQSGAIQRIASDQASVQVMTMHKAKGLEASLVFLYGGFVRMDSYVLSYHQDGQRFVSVGEAKPAPAIQELEEEHQRLLYVAATRAKMRLYLPYFGFAKDHEGTHPTNEVRQFKRLNGPYLALNQVLDRIVPEVTRLGASETDFEHEAVLDAPGGPNNDLDDYRRLSDWKPSNAEGSEGLTRTVAGPSRRRLGIPIESFSKLKRARGPVDAKEPPDAGPWEPRPESLDDPESTELPGGAATGRLLHELLELVSLETLREAPSFAFWAADTQVRRCFDHCFARHNITPSLLKRIQDMVYRAYRTPVRLGRHAFSEGLVFADHVVREMEFLYPIKDKEAKNSAPTPASGMIKGYIDLVVEHQGRVFIIDWKTDRLPSYEDVALDSYVEEHYRLQADLYTIAMLKLFGINSRAQYEKRFGGSAYCFLRAMGTHPRLGLVYKRWDWTSVCARRAELEKEIEAARGEDL